MKLKQLLGQNSFFAINKQLMKTIGINETILLSAFIDADSIFESDWFYQTIDTIEDLTTLKRSQQDKAIGSLISHGLLEKKLIGMPSKRHFKLNKNKIANMLAISDNTVCNIEQTSLQDQTIEFAESNNNKDNTINIIHKNNNKEIKDDDIVNSYINTYNILFSRSYTNKTWKKKVLKHYKLLTEVIKDKGKVITLEHCIRYIEKCKIRYDVLIERGNKGASNDISTFLTENITPIIVDFEVDTNTTKKNSY